MAKEMQSSVKITFIIAGTILILAAVMGVGMWIFFGLASAETINVDGIATIAAVPDVVSVYFSIEAKGADAQKAKDKNSEIMSMVLAGFAEIGIENKSISTENYNIQEDCSWETGRQVCSGWKATHDVRVKLSSSEINKVGEVVDAGVDSGALIRYINFELSQEKENDYKAEALKKAGEDARIKAESIAAGLDKEVGGIKSVSVQDFGYYPWRLYAAEDSVLGGSPEAAKSAVASIQPGEREVTGRVSVVFYLR